MSDTPWIKWYPADFLNGVADLSPHEIAVYTVVLCRIYDEGGPIPHDIKKIARRCNMRVPQCEKALKTLIEEDKLSSDGVVIDNKRARKELEKRHETSSKQSRNQRSRWQKEAKKVNKNNEGDIPPYDSGNTKPIPTRSQKPEPDKYNGAFDDFWNIYPKRKGTNPKKPAKQKFEAAVKRGVDPGDILRGAKGYAAQIKRDKTEPQFIKQAVTWINQECWEQYLPDPPTGGGQPVDVGNSNTPSQEERWYH